jgi:hypothetical protein
MQQNGGKPTSRESGSLPGLVLHLLGPLLHDLVLHSPCHHHCPGSAEL